MASGDNGDYQVTIEFLGICSHFLRTVAGVPHRVVLPQTNKVEYGSLQAGTSAAVTYALPPHVGFVVDPEQPPIDAYPGLVQGIVKTGVRLQIINAIDPPLIHDPSFDSVPRLRDYMPEFRYASDVVAGGRAQCYFDILRGKVTATPRSGGAVHTYVNMKTDGPPVLQITQLDVSSDPGLGLDTVYDVVVGPNLFVGNSSHVCKEAKVDFLWHYLTNESSIPLRLALDPPGFRNPVPCPEMWDALSKVAREGLPEDFVHKCIDAADDEDSPSCSNSRYP